MTPKSLVLKIGKIRVPCTEVQNLRRRAVVSGSRILTFIRMRGRSRDHEFGC